MLVRYTLARRHPEAVVEIVDEFRPVEIENVCRETIEWQLQRSIGTNKPFDFINGFERCEDAQLADERFEQFDTFILFEMTHYVIASRVNNLAINGISDAMRAIIMEIFLND